MAAIDDLKTEWTTKINALENAAIRKNKALVLLDLYIAAFTQLTTATATDMSSYSIAGRSVVRREIATYQDMVDRLEAQMSEQVYGNTTYFDVSRPRGSLDVTV